jgi:hypothetical protein
VFVPRTSRTSVATWFWQTEGRSAERVTLGVRPSEFILLELRSPSRRIFIGSLSPPRSGRLIGPSSALLFDLGKLVDLFVCLLEFRVFFFCVFLERYMKLAPSLDSKLVAS